MACVDQNFSVESLLEAFRRELALQPIPAPTLLSFSGRGLADAGCDLRGADGEAETDDSMLKSSNLVRFGTVGILWMARKMIE